jgi:hypothetical protein
MKPKPDQINRSDRFKSDPEVTEWIKKWSAAFVLVQSSFHERIDCHTIREAFHG